MKNEKLPKLIVILGPTASGKTELGVRLAKKFSGEIVSTDSRQVYKKMNIGTAKPTKKEIKIVPYYLIDFLNLNQKFNVALYKKMALKAIGDIQRRGKIPFLVGGTGLYIKAIVDNIEFPTVPAQKKLREKLEKKTVIELFEIYKKLDSLGARFIEKKNKRRLIRAIEVCKVTKKPFWQQRERGKSLFDILQIGMKLSKTELKKRIEKRIEKMFKMGLEKEVKKLVKKYGWNISQMQTIGYQEWREYFEGKINKEEIKRKINLHTIQFAKRQMTWFKRDKRIKWTPPTHHPYKWAEKLIKEFLSK
jgi:tRNA dimethylallyltransferase